MHYNDNYTNYGLRNNISPPQNPALTSVENNIYDMVKNIELRDVRRDFQDKLREDINKIRSSKNLFVFVDKSTSLYELWDTDYNRLLGNNITNNYSKCENGVKHRIVRETKKSLNCLNLVRRRNVTLAALPLSPLKITQQTFKITPNAD